MSPAYSFAHGCPVTSDDTVANGTVEAVLRMVYEIENCAEPACIAEMVLPFLS